MMLSSPASTFAHLSLTLSAIADRPRTQAAEQVAPDLKSSALQDFGRLSIRGMKDASETVVADDVDARTSASKAARNEDEPIASDV
jgi:hypothetical protein